MAGANGRIRQGVLTSKGGSVIADESDLPGLIGSPELTTSADGTMWLEFERSEVGTFRLDEPLEFVAAFQGSLADENAYHGPSRWSSSVTFLPDADADAQDKPVDVIELGVKEPEMPIEGLCTPSSLDGYDCLVDTGVSGYRLHYRNDRANAVAYFAAEAVTDGWVALGFPETSGLMVGAEVRRTLLPWLLIID